MSIIIKMKIVKASTSKRNGKPPPGDKSLGIDSSIRFYEIEDSDNTEEAEESEILVIHDVNLPATK